MCWAAAAVICSIGGWCNLVTCAASLKRKTALKSLMLSMSWNAARSPSSGRRMYLTPAGSKTSSHSREKCVQHRKRQSGPQVGRIAGLEHADDLRSGKVASAPLKAQHTNRAPDAQDNRTQYARSKLVAGTLRSRTAHHDGDSREDA